MKLPTTTPDRRTCHEQNRSIIYANFMPTLSERKKPTTNFNLFMHSGPLAAASDIG